MDQTGLVSVTRRLNVKIGAVKVMGVARENYLRKDLSCQSALCNLQSCSQLNSLCKGPLLSKESTHHLVPMSDVAKTFFEILEFREFSGMIFLQTVAGAVQQSGFNRYRRLCNLVRDQTKGSIFFANEFFHSTYCPRQPSESTIDWHMRACFTAIKWFYDHLNGQKPFVIVTEDESLIQRYRFKQVDIFVMTLGDYLKEFWPNLASAREIYESLAAALAEKESAVEGITSKSKSYEEYLRPDVIEAAVKAGKLVQGRIRVNKYHPDIEAFVSRSITLKSNLGDPDSEEILISGKYSRNRAIEGDIVAVQILPKSEWKSKINRLADTQKDEEDIDIWDSRPDVCPTGKVVGIIQRNWKSIVASIPPESVGESGGGKRILVFPFDRRIPKIRIMTSQAPHLLRNRIVVKIDNWPANSQYPNGHFVKMLGPVGDLEAEIKVLLEEHDIAERIGPFSQGILSEMPRQDWKPDPAEVARRKDFRSSHLIMSIDPVGCEDVDDALSVRRLSNGRIELGVFIADVTYFVPANSKTDLEAQRRATTVYLADRRYDMLPAVLSANVCSLLSGVDRYAMGVLWELDPETFQVASVWYGRTVIRSSYKLAYEVAQEILDGKSDREMKSKIPELFFCKDNDLQKKFGAIKESLKLLSSVAQAIQTRREKEGALRLEGAEVTFEFEKSSLEDIKPKQHLAVHETVAECMIFANEWVAKKISKAFPDRALLRRHPPPKKENFSELKLCAASRHFHIDTWSNKVLAESLDKCQDSNDPAVNFLLRSLATQAMVQAAYFSTGSVPPEDWEHYGLALKLYTHFTSPIRRYADVLVHRLLLSALENQDWWSDKKSKSSDLLSNTELQNLSEHINERNQAAQRAQRESQILFQTLYFKDKSVDDSRCICEGVIFSLKANGFLIYIPRYGLKGPVFLQDTQKREVLWCSEKLGPLWRSDGEIRQTDFEIHVDTAEGTQSYRLFDHVSVVIQLKPSQNDLHANRLAYYLLRKVKVSSKADDNVSKGEINFLKELKLKSESLKDDREEMKIENVDLESEKNLTYKFFLEMSKLGTSPDS